MMKKFFSRIRGNQPVATTATVTTPSMQDEAPTSSAIPVSRDLFVEDEFPRQKQVNVEQSGLDIFLNEDHYAKGLQDGYSQHSSEHLRKQVNAMAAEFRKLVQDEIDQLRRKDTEIRLHLAQVGENFSEFRQQLIIRMEAGRETMELHEKQQVNSIELEGRIAAPVKSYEAGYEAGLRNYLDENGFLSSQTI